MEDVTQRKYPGWEEEVGQESGRGAAVAVLSAASAKAQAVVEGVEFDARMGLDLPVRSLSCFLSKLRPREGQFFSEALSSTEARAGCAIQAVI
jgi:hypothetical protein